MIMGGVADGAINLAGESLGGDAAGAAPAAFERAASERSVAGEGELAAASGLHRALVNDAADAAWISRMPDAVQHHLGDRALALLAFGTRLVLDRLGQTIDRKSTRLKSSN